MIGCLYPIKVRSGIKFKFLCFIKYNYTYVPCLSCSWCKDNFSRENLSYNDYLKRYFHV